MNEKKPSPYHRTARLCGILLFAVAVFYAAVCTPIYQWSSADVAVSEVFTMIWDFLQSVVRFAFFWLAAAFVLVSVRAYGKARAVLLLCGGAALLLHVGSLLTGLLMMRDFDTVGTDLLDLVLSVALDVCQLALFRLVAYLTIERKPTAAGQSLPARAMAACAAVPSVFQIFNRILYDAAIGAPTGKSDLIVMITYYLVDLASAPVGYLVLLLVTDRLLLKQKETHK